MNTQIYPNAFSALCTDSEESDSDEMPVLMKNPDLGREQLLSYHKRGHSRIS